MKYQALIDFLKKQHNLKMSSGFKKDEVMKSLSNTDLPVVSWR